MDRSIFEEYKLNEEMQVECAEFAGLSNNNYGRRNQRDERRKQEQCFFGKLGEWVAYNRLAPFFADLSRPNMEIYEGRQKTWDNDLKAGDLAIAVKSCDFRGDSWIFQKSDADGKAGCDREIYDPNASDKLIVFVQIGYKNESGRIRAIAPLSELKARDLFVEPRKDDLIGIKEAVMLFSLKLLGFADKIHPSVAELVHKVQA